MAKFVRIQSEVTIKVTTGLQNKNETDYDAHIPDRLKVSPEWPKHTVLIRKGAHKYPAEIAEWPSVKALANDKVLTIGETTEVAESELEDEERKNLGTVTEAKAEFRLGLDKKDESTGNTGTQHKGESKGKSITLNDLAGGESK